MTSDCVQGDGQVFELCIRTAGQAVPIRVGAVEAIADVGLAGDRHASRASPRQVLIASSRTYQRLSAAHQPHPSLARRSNRPARASSCHSCKRRLNALLISALDPVGVLLMRRQGLGRTVPNAARGARDRSRAWPASTAVLRHQRLVHRGRFPKVDDFCRRWPREALALGGGREVVERN